jgi:LDH2 family malate/lactate/ureidoglycolate dehydrogenase
VLQTPTGRRPPDEASDTPSGRCVVSAPTLLSITTRCFEQLGVPPDDAQAVADVLIDANLSDKPSHGFQRLPALMKRVHAGLAGGTQRWSVVRQTGGLCRVAAGNALGPAAAVRAVDHAVSLAGEFGVSLVAVGGSSHFGCAGYYARRAALAGKVALVATNSVKRVAPFGAAQAFLGTNPLAIGVPIPDREPFVLDLATSIEAGGKVMRANQLGERLPPGVALDEEGIATTDPARALAGALLPIAGPKGSGLALAISLLAVLLGGADGDHEMAALHGDLDRPQNVGHVFIAIDASGIASPGDQSRLGHLVDCLLDLAPVDPGAGVRYPGQGQASLARSRWEGGVPLTPSELRLATEACRACGLHDLASEMGRLDISPRT